MPQGYQNDGVGHLWCAVARTPWGRIPGKAQGDTCWYPYGGQEHTTGDFYYIGKRGPRGTDPEVMRYATHGCPPHARHRRHHHPNDGDDADSSVGGALLLGLGVGLAVGVVGLAIAAVDWAAHDEEWLPDNEGG